MSRNAVRVAAGAVVEPFDYGQADTRRAHPLVTPASHLRALQLPRSSARRLPESASPAAAAPSPATTATAERDAFANGYAEGERAGIDAAARQLDAQRARLAQTLENLATLRERLTYRIERQVVELALAVAGRILHREITLDRELLLVMARVALDRLGDVPAATVRLHPDDEAAVRGGRTEWPHGALAVVADPGVKPGGCNVQTDLGHIELGIDAQLRELATALLGHGSPVGGAETP